MSNETTGITGDMREIIRSAILCFAATVNEDGTPNLSPKASLTTRGDSLYFANIASPGTVANLRRDPSIEINVIDVFARRGYRFKGRAKVLGAGEGMYDDISKWVKAVNGDIYPVFDVVQVKVSAASELRSPAYAIGNADEASLRSVYLEKYGAIAK